MTLNFENTLFLSACHYFNLQDIKISFEYVDFYAKLSLIFDTLVRNSKTQRRNILCNHFVITGTAGLSIILFVFAAIWYIDPALLTLVLRFRQARCTTKNQAFLIGISNCSWTSCRLGCTREIYKCWQIQVSWPCPGHFAAFLNNKLAFLPKNQTYSDFQLLLKPR